MDDQQNMRAGPGLHAGTEREAGSDCVRGDVAGMHDGGEVTTEEKQATYDRVKDSLANIMGGRW